MQEEKPIRRHDALKPLSREHHYGLLLCWKIKTGFAKGVSAERIKAYADWFYKSYLLPHFELEEKYIFPLLGNDHDFIRQALAEHQLLSAHFLEKDTVKTSLETIAVELEKHIRFEERILFNMIQEAATAPQLEAIKHMHAEKHFVENGNDVFWI